MWWRMNRSTEPIIYWPTEDMEAYLRLRNRVQARKAGHGGIYD